MPASSAIRRNGGAPPEASAIRYSAADHSGARVLLTLSGILKRHQPSLALNGREVSETCGAETQFDHAVVETFATAVGTS